MISDFSSFDVGGSAHNEVVDLDGDHDLDVIVGGRNGRVTYLENVGTSVVPAFVERTGFHDPFAGIDVGERSSPAIADLDADGDFDLLVGEDYGQLLMFINVGSSTTPRFVAATGTTNPFSSFDVGYQSSPAFVDLDGDQDFDLVVGEHSPGLYYFENTGSANAPAFAERTGPSSPVGGIDTSYTSLPEFVDMDRDGDFDLFVGGVGIEYFENVGTPIAATFLYRAGGANPLLGRFTFDGPSPSLVDLDADGDLDAVLGGISGTLAFFRNSGTTREPLFDEEPSSNNPLAGVDVGFQTNPELADLDGDGDLDAILGNFKDPPPFFENTGSVAAPAFELRTGTQNPLTGFNLQYASTELVDLDGDGDLDAVFGGELGRMRFLSNTGTAKAASFVERTGSANPLRNVDVGSGALPELADLDGDGDFDAAIGESYGTVKFLENTGTSHAPAFLMRTGAANPFNLVDLMGLTGIKLVDLDADGDLDLVTGEFLGPVRLFENVGTSGAATFVESPEAGNPFARFAVGEAACPEVADLDGDGDLDSLIGEESGHVVFFESLAQDSLFSDGFESGDTSAWSARVP